MFRSDSISEWVSDVLKHSSNREKQVIPLMISNGGWHYVTVKELPALLRGLTSKYCSDFYCLKCLQSLATENNPKSVKVCKIKRLS